MSLDWKNVIQPLPNQTQTHITHEYSSFWGLWISVGVGLVWQFVISASCNERHFLHMIHLDKLAWCENGSPVWQICFANNLDHPNGPAVEKRTLGHGNLSSYFDHLNGLEGCKKDSSVQFAIVSRDVHICILERGVLFMTRYQIIKF